MIARLDTIVESMDDIIQREADEPWRTPWRGPEAESRTKRERERTEQFQLLVDQAAAIGEEAFRLLKSEGIDISAPKLDKLERSMGSSPSRKEIVQYCRLATATLRAKSYLIE